jgi:serine/threonine protein phosphatase PrpC
MSHRLATRIGLPLPEERAGDALDEVRFREPVIGAEVRTKGSLFLLAQVTGGDRAVNRAAREVLEGIEHDYYYDLSAGVLGSLAKALGAANRRLFHQRARLGIPRRAGVSVIAIAIRGREAHVAKLGPAAAVILRAGRMFELPPPPAAAEEDPRVRERRVAATLGEALEIEPYTWQGELAGDDRVALVSRNLAQVVGVDELKRALLTLRPSQAVEHLQHLFQIRGGSGSDGVMALEVDELPITTATHHLEPVHPAEPLAGLPDQSPVPLADAIGRGLHRAGDAVDELQSLSGRALLTVMSWVLAFVPRRRPKLREVARTEVREEGRRRRFGLAGMVVVALLLAVGSTVASLPGPRPTDAIPRAADAAAAIAVARQLVDQVDATVDGKDLVARDPTRATQMLNDAYQALQRASASGIGAEQLATLQTRVDRGLDALYGVTRLTDVTTVADLAASYDHLQPTRMVAATDGSFWIVESGRGRVIRVDPATGRSAVVYRAGQKVGDLTLGAPWLIATAATDVVIVDRERQAWREDLTQQTPHALALNGIARVSASSTLLAALQNEPPLEIFNLYLVDAGRGAVLKWMPPALIPIRYPSAPESYLTAAADLPVAGARDLVVDANVWLLHSNTVTRVNFGRPLPQTDYSFDPPPDRVVRPTLDYRLLSEATVGDRELFYVYDAANARILAYQRADGAFVKQWLAPRAGPSSAILDHVTGLQVRNTADGPPVAYLLAGDRLLRIVLE